MWNTEESIKNRLFLNSEDTQRSQEMDGSAKEFENSLVQRILNIQPKYVMTNRCETFPTLVVKKLPNNYFALSFEFIQCNTI